MILGFFKKTSLFLQSLTLSSITPFKKTLIFLFSLPFCLLAAIYLNLFRNRVIPFLISIRGEKNFKLNFLTMDVIACYLYLFESWEPDCSAYICRNLKPENTFIDIGANIGYYSLLTSLVVGEKGRVIAIEASPKIFAVLQDNIRLNDLASNVKAYNLAVTDTPGKASVYLGPEGNLGSTTTNASLKRKFPYRNYKFESGVKAVTLDSLINPEDIKSLQMIKIDVEGTEREVIGGMQEIIKNGSPELEILIELTPLWWYKPKPSIEEVLQPFFKNGFKAYQIPNSYLPWRYLWPSMIQAPRKVKGNIKSAWGQIDLVLSKKDQEFLN